MTGWRLISDVGGTNVRFARVFNEENVVQRFSYPASRFDSFLDALRTYADETGGINGCCGAAIAAAGPVSLGSASLTNLSWLINEAEVAAEIGVPCTVINDVEAAAHSMPALSINEYIALGGPAPNLGTAHRLVIVNIGTGFGAAGLVRTAVGWMSSPSEAGHMSLPIPEGREVVLRPNFKSVEDALSGRGLPKLHAALSGDASQYTAEEICTLPEPKFTATLRVFNEIAGDVLGNVALALAAWDGVFLLGSVAKGFAHAADHAALREAFENKGPMKELMRRIPLALIEKVDPTLFGLAALSFGPPRL